MKVPLNSGKNKLQLVAKLMVLSNIPLDRNIQIGDISEGKVYHRFDILLSQEGMNSLHVIGPQASYVSSWY